MKLNTQATLNLKLRILWETLVDDRKLWDTQYPPESVDDMLKSGDNGFTACLEHWDDTDDTRWHVRQKRRRGGADIFKLWLL